MNLIYIFCIIFLIILIFVIIESIIEIRQLKITNYDIKNSKLPKEFIGYKLIVLADIHNCFYNSKKIIEIIKEEKPNGVILAGDMLVYGDNQTINNMKSLELIKEISNYSDVYYAPGNHEMGYMMKKNHEWIDYEKCLINNDIDNIYYLDNKVIDITRNKSSIKIYGLHLTDGYYKRIIKQPLDKDVINKLLNESETDKFNILIAHNPDYFKEYCNWGADLVISGHNHGGLINLPILGGVISPRLRIFPKYDSGLFYENDCVLVLSSGIGAHTLKIRVNNKPELIIIKLNA